MKTLKSFALAGTLIAAILLVSCTKEDAKYFPMNSSSTNGSSIELNDLGKAGLLLLVEKEKLHRDVYLTMSEKCQLPFVSEFCNCDEKFMNLLVVKIEKYGLDNPIENLGVGEFKSSGIQAVYNQFTEDCELGETKMLNFVKQMEESILDDIRDNQENVAGNANFIQMYSQLYSASQNQLDLINNELGVHLNFVEPDPVINAQ